MYFWRKFAINGMLTREYTIKKPRMAYVSILPREYAIPEKRTDFGFVIFFERKETAAIFVARGQGLIEVSMPSQNAVKKARITPIILTAP
jgi:hypothetical protein